MIRMTTNLISCSSDSGIVIFESNAFSGKIKNWKDDSISVSAGYFLLPSGFCLFLDLGFVWMEKHSLSASMSFSFRSTFIRAFITLCFAVECSMRPVLTYFRKPMLATRCVENLLKFTQVRSNYSVDMIL